MHDLGGKVVLRPPKERPGSSTVESGNAAANDSSRFIVAVHVASLVVGFGVLLVVSRGQWFKSDDWSYVVFRSLPSDVVGTLFEPYNGHWSTAPILQFRILFSAFGLHDYAPYLVPTLVLQVGVGHVLWRLMRQIGISTWIATSLAGAFIVNGGTATVLFAPIQFGFIGALLLGLIAIMMANHPTPDGRREAAAAAIAVLSLTFSGVAPAIVAGAVTVAFLRRGWRGATRLGVPAAAVYLLWFAIWGHEDVGNDGFAFGDLAHVPDFVWSGLRTTVDLGTPLRALSAVLVAALGVWLVLHRRWARTDAAPAFAMVIAAVLLYFIISSQRIAVFEATGSVPDRYAYISWALVLPAFGLALHDIGRRTTIRRVIAVVVGAVLLVNALSDLRQEYNKQAARARRGPFEHARSDGIRRARAVPSECHRRLQLGRRGDARRLARAAEAWRSPGTSRLDPRRPAEGGDRRAGALQPETDCSWTRPGQRRLDAFHPRRDGGTDLQVLPPGRARGSRAAGGVYRRSPVDAQGSHRPS